jgi:2-C-methyl-D-erythritol 2,4-cyclodiphosphate synthase
VIAESPKLGPYKKQMAERLAKEIGLDPSWVNVKATTNETMGFLGRGEGVAAMAVALVVERSDG